MKFFLPVLAALFVLSVSLSLPLQPSYAIVSGHPVMAEKLHSDYQYDLLVVFFVIVSSSLLVTLVIHYYRMQWGRKSVMTR